MQTPSEHWYRNFFHGVALDMWRQFVTPEMTSADVDFLLGELALPPGARVIDAPCGNGRHSIELARRGYQPFGVDIAAESIAEARAAAPSLSFHLGDMRELPKEASYEGAFCFGNSFGYLPHEATMEYLDAVAKSLRPGARFVLETGIAAESILPNLEDRVWMQVDDILFCILNEYDVTAGRLNTEYMFVRDGKTDVRPGSSAVYGVAEIGRMFRSVGLRPVAHYEDMSRKPYKYGSRRLLIVAEQAG